MKRLSSRFVAGTLAVSSVLCGTLLYVAPPASADSSTVTVAVSNTSPVLGNYYLGDSAGAGCVIANGAQMRYETYQLNVTVPGVYTFTDEIDLAGNTDMYIAVYPLGGFNPANIHTSCISTGDENPAQIALSSATSYTLVAAAYSGQINAPTQALGFSGPGEAYLGALRVAAPIISIPMWVQAYARASQAEACTAGWNPSWEQWPHSGTGGWVCTRSVLARG